MDYPALDRAVAFVRHDVILFSRLANCKYRVHRRDRHVPSIQHVDVESHPAGQFVGIVPLVARQLELPLLRRFGAKVDEIVFARLAAHVRALPLVDRFNPVGRRSCEDIAQERDSRRALTAKNAALRPPEERPTGRDSIRHAQDTCPR